MIIRFFLAKKAVPPLMVGIAFFLAACQTKAPPPVKVEQVTPEPFVLAEEYLQNGELKKALNVYETFLQHAPKDERSALALKRTSEIYLKLNQPKNALTILEKISRKYPDYTWIPGVRYEIADILSRIGEHKRSADQALEWLDRYPGHPLKKDILILLGDNFSALGYKVNAFHWWLKAKEAWSGDLTHWHEVELDPEPPPDPLDEIRARLDALERRVAGSSAPGLRGQLQRLAGDDDSAEARNARAVKVLEAIDWSFNDCRIPHAVENAVDILRD